MFINQSQILGRIIGEATAQSTGSIFLTLLFIMLFFVAIALLFGIRLEYTVIIVMPLLLSYATYYSEFVGLLLVVLIYMAIILTKNFIVK